jgi:hypothetical protein
MGARRGLDRTTNYDTIVVSQLYRIFGRFYHSTFLHDRRIAGIEPASSPWQREILPFDYIRIFFVPDTNARICPHIYDIYDISYMRLDHICAGSDTIQLYIVYTYYSIVRFQLRYLIIISN